MAQREHREVRKTQREDELIERWRKAVIDNTVPRNVYSKEDLTMKKQFKNFRMKRGILFRNVQDDDKVIEQLVLPAKYRKDVLRGLHNDVGHPGKERTMRLLKERYYWPGMSSAVDSWVNRCDSCIRRKSSTNERAQHNISIRACMF